MVSGTASVVHQFFPKLIAVRQQPFTEIEEPVSISSNILLAEKVNVDPEPLGEIDSTMPTSSIIPVNNLPFQFRKRALLVLMYSINTRKAIRKNSDVIFQ